jgi:hypothetical protein
MVKLNVHERPETVQKTKYHSGYNYEVTDVFKITQNFLKRDFYHNLSFESTEIVGLLSYG